MASRQTDFIIGKFHRPDAYANLWLIAEKIGKIIRIEHSGKPTE